MSAQALSSRARMAVLLAGIAGLLFDGVERGLMPAASLPVWQGPVGHACTPTLGRDWFAPLHALISGGASWGLIYLLGLVAIRGAPDTRKLEEGIEP